MSSMYANNHAVMDGIPWELGSLPGRVPKLKDQLYTVAERSGQSSKATPVLEDAPSFDPHTEEEAIIDENKVPRKVQKDQINLLAKMLSALKR